MVYRYSHDDGVILRSADCLSMGSSVGSVAEATEAPPLRVQCRQRARLPSTWVFVLVCIQDREYISDSMADSDEDLGSGSNDDSAIDMGALTLSSAASKPSRVPV